jgi:hypothetical protein
VAVIAGEPQRISAAGPFTHMAKRDAAVWVRFLERHAAEFLAVTYDVALGGVEPAGVEPALATGWQYSTALKIDAVLWAPNAAWLCEVRPWVQAGALGQVLCYVLVAQREGFTPLPVRPMLVCEGIQPDVRWVAGELGVRVELV